MNSLLVCLIAALSLSLATVSAQVSLPQLAFEKAVRKFGVDHDRIALREACTEAVATDSGFALPHFYLGLVDEADEKWQSAMVDFDQFLKLSHDTALSSKARRELTRLPALIKEDSTPAGKTNRQYAQHLQYAAMLEKEGFAKEALLEASEAEVLSPGRWEAYATASGILLSQHRTAEAGHFLELARKHIPPMDEAKLNGLTRAFHKEDSEHAQVP